MPNTFISVYNGDENDRRMAWHELAHWSASSIGAVLAATVLIGPVHADSPSSYVVTNWQTEQGLPQNSVYDIVQDGAGYLWLATAGGIVRFDGVRFKVFGAANIPTLRTNRMSCLHESRSGDLWVGTFNSGVIRLHDGVPTTYTDRDGLPGNLINSIREDAGGTLWVNTPHGIARFNGSRFEHYPSHRGKAVTEFFLQAQDGSMWFRSGMDVVRFGSDGSESSPARGFMLHETPDGSIWIAFLEKSRIPSAGLTSRTAKAGALAVLDVSPADGILLFGVLLIDQGVGYVGLEAKHPALGPVRGDDFFDQQALFGADRLKLLIVSLGELSEYGLVLAGND